MRSEELFEGSSPVINIDGNLALKPSLPSEPEVGATTTEKAEFELECAWIFYEQGNYRIALSHGKMAKAQKKLDLCLKLKINDLIALCYRQMNQDREVYLFLQKSIKYLNRFPSESFAFSIYSNYLEALVKLGFEKEAMDEFEKRPKYFKKIKDDMEWMNKYALIRKLEYLYAKEYLRPEKAWHIIESLNEIAEFIEDQDLVNFCEQEMELYRFEETNVFLFTEWTYLRDDELVLFPAEKKVSRLNKKDNIKKIINMLLQGPMRVERFFKRVTNKTFEDESHEKFLLQILSKVKKALNDQAVVLTEEVIHLR